MNPPVQFRRKHEEILRERMLDSWKEIARFLNRDVRTVMRWEKTRGLPVRRMPGGKKPGVYALQSELEAWRNDRSQVRAPDSGAAAAGATSPSIAVLPFLNLSPEKENEFFSDGLADEIITLLTRLPDLRVTARTSSFAFRGWNGDVREIGSKLRVRTLLEGSVQYAGGRMRISVQLVNASDGFHLWGEIYDRKPEDIFAVQDDISRAVARALRIHLVPGSVPAGRRTGDMEAYRECLKGRYLLQNRRSVEEAIAGRDCFARAVEIDPGFVSGCLGLAEYYREAAFLEILPPWEAFQRGRRRRFVRWSWTKAVPTPMRPSPFFAGSSSSIGRRPSAASCARWSSSRRRRGFSAGTPCSFSYPGDGSRRRRSGWDGFWSWTPFPPSSQVIGDRRN